MSEATSQITSAASLETQNYRIRRIEVVLDLDLYDDDGFLVQRGKTDAITIAEAQFPPALVEALKTLTTLNRGFAMRLVPSPAPPATPAT